MLDQQSMSALTAALQQALQILQQATAGGGADPSMMNDGGDDMPASDDMQEGMDDGSGEGEEDGDMGDDGMGGGASLHDRVSQLEDHTGLQKSAGTPLLARIATLEEEILGEEWEGPTIDRIQQLEKAAGVQRRPRRQTRRQAQRSADTAPDVIPLDSLIKSAIAEGLQRAGIQQQAPQADLPDPTRLRKEAARNAAARVASQRRSVQRSESEDQLNKSVGIWAEDELDQPVTFGDVLQLEYNAMKSGYMLTDPDDD